MAKSDTQKVESLDDFKRLSPQERIAKLREFEEKRRREIQEAEKMLKDTITQVEVDKKDDDVVTFQTLRDKIKPLDEILETERRTLEEQAKAALPTKEEQDAMQYNIAKEVKQIYEGVQSLGYTSDWGREEKSKFDQFQDRLSKIVENYQLSTDVQKQVMVSQNLVDNVKQYMSGHNEPAGGMGGYHPKGKQHKQYLN